MREAEAALRHIQLRRRDPEVEKNAGERVARRAREPRRSASSSKPACSIAKSRVVPKPLASVSHRVRVFVQSE